MWFANKLKLRKGLTLSVSFVFYCFAVCGQSGFNLRSAVEGNTVFQSVHCAQDSSFIIAAWSRDTSTNDHLDFELLNFNLNGELQLRHSYNTPDCIVNISEESESNITNFIVQPEQSIKNGKYAHQVFWHDSSLDTLFSTFIQSPFMDSTWIDSDFMYSQFAALSKDTILFYAFGVWKPETTGNDVCIKKLSSTGEELWMYIYATDATDACYALLPQEDGGVIAGIYHTSIDENPAQDKLIKIDSSGDEQWQIDIPGGYITKLVNCIICDADMLVLSGRYQAIGELINGTLPIVIKMDTLGNLIWSNIHGIYEDGIRKDFTNIVQTCDSNYVAGGTWLSSLGSEEIIEGQNNPDYDSFAHIVKLNQENGEIIWERKYRFLEIYRDQHELIDMKATLDGGVIFCGEARDSYQMLDAPYQQGWLVKLDECGCLVPGCDSLCSYVGCSVADTAFFPTFGSHFIVGPNPASQFINIYFAGGDLNLSQTHFDIYDLQGRLVYSFAPDAADTTYMLSTEKFASGTYVLMLHHNGEKMQEQKVIIAEQ